MMKKDTKSLFWGLAAGTLAGAVTALLLTPKTGKEMRRTIADGTHTAIDKTREFADQATEVSTEWAGKAKDAAKVVVQEIREWRCQCEAGEETDEKVLVSGFQESGNGEPAETAAAGEEAVAGVEDGTDNGQ